MSKIDYNLKVIKGIVFDVDGVLSPSTVPLSPNGTPSRMVNVKDGYAMQLAVKMGYKIAIMTGADCEAYRTRLNSLGIKDVFLKTAIKITCLKTWIEANGLIPSEVAFVGDDYGLGGNDESVYKSDFGFITIDNYLDFPKVVAHLLD